MKWSMRRPWIKVEVSTPDKPEICAIASRLRIDEDAVVGKLIRLWAWAELNRINPNDLSVTKVFLDKLVSKKGFADAMLLSGWLCLDGERLHFPNFDKHNGQDSKVRGLTAKRVEKHRRSNSSINVTSVTDAEKRVGKTDKELSKLDNVIIGLNEATCLSDNDLNKFDEDISSQAYETPEKLPTTANIEPIVNDHLIAEDIVVTPKKRNPKSNTATDDQPLLF